MKKGGREAREEESTYKDACARFFGGDLCWFNVIPAH